MDLTTKQGVCDYMRQATSANDWDSRLDLVIGYNKGYPSFWFEAVILSGLAKEVGSTWTDGYDGELHITTLD